MQSAAPVIKDLVLLGGGHSHIAVLKSFGMRPIPGIRLTLISRDIETPYSGMLPGLVAGHYTSAQAHIDLVPLSRFSNARFFCTDVVGLDPATQTVLLSDRPPVPYDVLSINTGSTPSAQDITGAATNAVPVKPISQFLARWAQLLERVLKRTDPVHIAVVGGGAGGVELSLAAHYALTESTDTPAHAPAKFTLITADPEILPTFPPSVARRLRRVLQERGIEVRTDTRICEVAPGRLTDAARNELAFDEILWVTQASAPAWLGAAGLATDDHGFVLINDHLQSLSHANIFAAGDVASMERHPRPKAGVFAVRQGPPLVRNLRHFLLGQSLSSYRPQRDFLTLISTGDQCAVAARGRWSAEGRWVWRWKDWIDRRFMQRFQRLPEMGTRAEQTLPTALRALDPRVHDPDGMRCGGCGAKVGADALSAALEGLRPVSRDDVITGLNEPDDAALIAVPPGKLSVLSVDAFRPMIDDPYVFGQITANHCLGDIYAMGAEPQTAMTIATMPVWPEEKLIDELRQMLLGAQAVFGTEGVALVGGHTSEAAEVSLGFSVTGLIERDKVLRKATLRQGDILILTKAVGTGTLLAANMRASAQGRWISSALASMLSSNRGAGQQLQIHGASACTDITGFGLLGHLLEMLRASPLGATINLDALPVLKGASETLAAGVVSTLQLKNERCSRYIENIEAARRHPSYRLLFDPQTSGGLLAGIAAGRAQECIEALRKHGHIDCAIIGRVDIAADRFHPVRIV